MIQDVQTEGTCVVHKSALKPSPFEDMNTVIFYDDYPILSLVRSSDRLLINNHISEGSGLDYQSSCVAYWDIVTSVPLQPAR